MAKMKLSDVYRKAAQKVENEGGCSCNAVWHAADYFSHPMKEMYKFVEPYRKMFSPNARNDDAYWLGDSVPSYEVQDWRVLALCFMAAIMESEGN